MANQAKKTETTKSKKLPRVRADAPNAAAGLPAHLILGGHAYVARCQDGATRKVWAIDWNIADTHVPDNCNARAEMGGRVYYGVLSWNFDANRYEFNKL